MTHAEDAHKPLNVVEFFGCHIEGSTLYLITDFCETNLRSFWEKILLGLSCLHAHGILHRNLKPENILIRPSVGRKRNPTCAGDRTTKTTPKGVPVHGERQRSDTSRTLGAPENAPTLRGVETCIGDENGPERSIGKIARQTRGGSIPSAERDASGDEMDQILPDVEVELSDFGFSRLLQETAGAYTPENPKDRERSYRESRRLFYRAPELLLMRGEGTAESVPVYSFGVDIWSVAIIFMELALLRPPFRGESEMIYLLQVSKRTRRTLPAVKQNPFFPPLAPEAFHATRPRPIGLGGFEVRLPSETDLPSPAQATQAQSASAQTATQARGARLTGPVLSASHSTDSSSIVADARGIQSTFCPSRAVSSASPGVGPRGRLAGELTATLPRRREGRSERDGEDEREREQKRRAGEGDRGEASLEDREEAGGRGHEDSAGGRQRGEDASGPAGGRGRTLRGSLATQGERRGAMPSSTTSSATERNSGDPGEAEVAFFASAGSHLEQGESARRFLGPSGIDRCDSARRRALVGPGGEHSRVQENAFFARWSSQDTEETTLEGAETAEAALLKEAEMWVRMLPLWPPVDWDGVISSCRRKEEAGLESKENEETEDAGEAQVDQTRDGEVVNFDREDEEGNTAEAEAGHQRRVAACHRAREENTRGEAKPTGNLTEEQEKLCPNKGFPFNQRCNILPLERRSPAASKKGSPPEKTGSEPLREKGAPATDPDCCPIEERRDGKVTRQKPSDGKLWKPTSTIPLPPSSASQRECPSSSQEAADVLRQFGRVMGPDGLELLREMLQLKGKDRISAAAAYARVCAVLEKNRLLRLKRRRRELLRIPVSAQTASTSADARPATSVSRKGKPLRKHRSGDPEVCTSDSTGDSGVPGIPKTAFSRHAEAARRRENVAVKARDDRPRLECLAAAPDNSLFQWSSAKSQESSPRLASTKLTWEKSCFQMPSKTANSRRAATRPLADEIQHERGEGACGERKAPREFFSRNRDEAEKEERESSPRTGAGDEETKEGARGSERRERASARGEQRPARRTSESEEVIEKETAKPREAERWEDKHNGEESEQDARVQEGEDAQAAPLSNAFLRVSGGLPFASLLRRLHALASSAPGIPVEASMRRVAAQVADCFLGSAATGQRRRENARESETRKSRGDRETEHTRPDDARARIEEAVMETLEDLRQKCVDLLFRLQTEFDLKASTTHLAADLFHRFFCLDLLPSFLIEPWVPGGESRALGASRVGGFFLLFEETLFLRGLSGLVCSARAPRPARPRPRLVLCCHGVHRSLLAAAACAKIADVYSERSLEYYKTTNAHDYAVSASTWLVSRLLKETCLSCLLRECGWSRCEHSRGAEHRPSDERRGSTEARLCAESDDREVQEDDGREPGLEGREESEELEREHREERENIPERARLARGTSESADSSFSPVPSIQGSSDFAPASFLRSCLSASSTSSSSCSSSSSVFPSDSRISAASSATTPSSVLTASSALPVPSPGLACSSSSRLSGCPSRCMEPCAWEKRASAASLVSLEKEILQKLAFRLSRPTVLWCTALLWDVTELSVHLEKQRRQLACLAGRACTPPFYSQTRRLCGRDTTGEFPERNKRPRPEAETAAEEEETRRLRGGGRTFRLAQERDFDARNGLRREGPSPPITAPSRPTPLRAGAGAFSENAERKATKRRSGQAGDVSEDVHPRRVRTSAAQRTGEDETGASFPVEKKPEGVFSRPATPSMHGSQDRVSCEIPTSLSQTHSAYRAATAATASFASSPPLSRVLTSVSASEPPLGDVFSPTERPAASRVDSGGSGACLGARRCAPAGFVLPLPSPRTLQQTRRFCSLLADLSLYDLRLVGAQPLLLAQLLHMRSLFTFLPERFWIAADLVARARARESRSPRGRVRLRGGERRGDAADQPAPAKAGSASEGKKGDDGNQSLPTKPPAKAPDAATPAPSQAAVSASLWRSPSRHASSSSFTLSPASCRKRSRLPCSASISSSSSYFSTSFPSSSSPLSAPSSFSSSPLSAPSSSCSSPLSAPFSPSSSPVSSPSSSSPLASSFDFSSSLAPLEAVLGPLLVPQLRRLLCAGWRHPWDILQLGAAAAELAQTTRAAQEIRRSPLLFPQTGEASDGASTPLAFLRFASLLHARRVRQFAEREADIRARNGETEMEEAEGRLKGKEEGRAEEVKREKGKGLTGGNAGGEKGRRPSEKQMMESLSISPDASETWSDSPRTHSSDGGNLSEAQETAAEGGARLRVGETAWAAKGDEEDKTDHQNLRACAVEESALDAFEGETEETRDMPRSENLQPARRETTWKRPGASRSRDGWRAARRESGHSRERSRSVSDRVKTVEQNASTVPKGRPEGPTSRRLGRLPPASLGLLLPDDASLEALLKMTRE
ncbi:putative protein kinase (incomplete catalytic triad) [Neospora caninum Liverpool]|uniref:Protein kinase domain-containing protein n=1 Tax=Neospora caninum (strain Liverpool) TaxID=572307 RepID=F0V781_NEOCL|nr:putative protein kinase (incomplete catalytic triad) [Neospora caninum Liverpool]CBZ49572.1 putative protein kinase (incomplete catalytic triad) [Neospora caninum Liverpool]|eukprot:XP_003879607.1 putative protein kinase (incomplete catalytic triad) [Neospora caninum Liverpool]